MNLDTLYKVIGIKEVQIGELRGQIAKLKSENAVLQDKLKKLGGIKDGKH